MYCMVEKMLCFPDHMIIILLQAAASTYSHLGRFTNSVSEPVYKDQDFAIDMMIGATFRWIDWEGAEARYYFG